MRELSLLLVMLSAALVFFTTTAQAQIFQNFFGGQQYEAREQEAPPVSKSMRKFVRSRHFNSES